MTAQRRAASTHVGERTHAEPMYSFSELLKLVDRSRQDFLVGFKMQSDEERRLVSIMRRIRTRNRGTEGLDRLRAWTMSAHTHRRGCLQASDTDKTVGGRA